MNHGLTLTKNNEKENPESKVQTIKCYRISTVKDLKKEKKELVKKKGGGNHNSTNYFLINKFKKYLIPTSLQEYLQFLRLQQ